MTPDYGTFEDLQEHAYQAEPQNFTPEQQAQIACPDEWRRQRTRINEVGIALADLLGAEYGLAKRLYYSAAKRLITDMGGSIDDSLSAIGDVTSDFTALSKIRKVNSPYVILGEIVGRWAKRNRTTVLPGTMAAALQGVTLKQTDAPWLAQLKARDGVTK
jgi:hypothetical protein